MSRPRAWTLVLAQAITVVLLSGTCLPQASAMQTRPDPTQHQIDAAKRKLALAGRRLASLQAAAEHAAEAYNGAKVDAARKAKAASAAARQAEAASIRAESAQREATTAEQQQRVAAATAVRGREAQHTAETAVTAGQGQLDRYANNAYRDQGSIGMLAAVLSSGDPDQLIDAHDVMGRIGDHQQAVITDLTVAKNISAVTARLATASERRAAGAARHATSQSATAKRALEDAQRKTNTATTAAAVSKRAVRGAERARLHAVALVGQAEALLGSARATVADLQAQAAAARRAAAQARKRAAVVPSTAAGVAISWAYKQVGTPYSWGGGDQYGPTRGFAQGANTIGFDCSGLTLYAYAHAGIRLDHYTGLQYVQGKRISRQADLLPGDLMFFATDTSDPSTIHHVSIYLGNGLMIHAPQTGEVVKVSSAKRSDFIGGTRPWQ